METCNCGKPIKTENDAKRGICFSCHVRGLKFGFAGGRDAFSNGPTAAEQHRYYRESKAFKEGRIEPVPARKELI